MNCPICLSSDNVLWSTSTDFEYRTTEDSYRYLQCVCGIIFLEDPPKDQLSTIYPSSYYSFQNKRGNFIFRIKSWADIRRFGVMLSSLPHQELSVLDVGGGNGEICDALRRCDPRVKKTTIVDLDPKLIKYHELGAHSYVCSRVEDFKPEHLFDVIVLINLIEHVDDPRSVLRKVHSMLSLDGLIVIQTPNTGALDARLFRRSHWGGLHTPRHWVLFNRKNLKNLLDETGFCEVAIRRSQGAPFWAVSFFYLLRRSRLGRQSERPIHARFSFNFCLMVFGVLDGLRARLGFETSQMYVTARSRLSAP